MKNKPAPGSSFNTHLLSLVELWWARERPFNKRVVAVKNLAAKVEAAEKALEEARGELERAVQSMNEEREAHA